MIGVEKGTGMEFCVLLSSLLSRWIWRREEAGAAALGGLAARAGAAATVGALEAAPVGALEGNSRGCLARGLPVSLRLSLLEADAPELMKPRAETLAVAALLVTQEEPGRAGWPPASTQHRQHGHTNLMHVG